MCSDRELDDKGGFNWDPKDYGDSDARQIQRHLKKNLLLPSSIGPASTQIGKSTHDLDADALKSHRSRNADKRLLVVNQKVDSMSHYSYEFI